MNIEKPCQSINCTLCQHGIYNCSTAIMHKKCHMKHWYEAIDQSAFKEKQWNYIKARRAAKKKLVITQEDVDLAKTEYFAKGGKITFLENPAFTNFYNSFNIHSSTILGAYTGIHSIGNDYNNIGK